MNFKVEKPLLILVLLAFSCSQADRPSEGILSQEEMVKVLSELYVFEEKVSRRPLIRDSAENLFKSAYGKVFEKTGVSDSVFKKSFEYYLDRPKELELIYTALVDSLQLQEQRVDYRPDKQ
ncbi:MAG: DUF4296 domain-containing protein [Bacteroidota bacterium]